MTLRCASCNRSLLRYAVVVQRAGGLSFGLGPRCGRDLLAKESRRRTHAVRAIKQPLQADPNQLTLELA
jgi:hypothetical protein